jgi:hypothetical protein
MTDRKSITRNLAAGLAALIIAFTTACGTDEPAPDRAACKSAVNEQLYGPNFDGEAVKTTWPKECKGFDQATLDKIVDEIVDER